MPLFYRWADNHSPGADKPKNRSDYMPQPIWFAMNHKAIIETGTPSNQATPYFIISPLEQIRNSILQLAFQTRLGITVAMNTAEVVMRTFNHPLGSASMALVTEGVDIGGALKNAVTRLRRKARQLVCTVVNGGHELYRARTDTKLYQQCLLCGYETPGWTIDRRDRRLHLVSNSQQTAARR
jgi:hypothetical protein